jgi:2-keto-4-pentenoate hydratase
MNGAAEVLVDIRHGRTPRPAALPEDCAPRSDAEAYTVQLQVLKRLGAYVGGWKASMPDASGGFSAPIAANNILRQGAALAAPALLTANTTTIGVEPEIAFTMARTLPAGASYTRAQVLQAVAGAHAAIELCVCRLSDFDNAPRLDRLADSIMNEALSISVACTTWGGLELKSLPLRLLIDGQPVYQGIGGHPLGDPLIPLVWMANHLSERGIGLQAGDVITTGSCAGCRQVPLGSSVEVEFAELGVVRVQL